MLTDLLDLLKEAKRNGNAKDEQRIYNALAKLGMDRATVDTLIND